MCVLFCGVFVCVCVVCVCGYWSCVLPCKEIVIVYVQQRFIIGSSRDNNHLCTPLTVHVDHLCTPVSVHVDHLCTPVTVHVDHLCTPVTVHVDH